MDWLNLIGGTMLGGLISWAISHIYYRKSLTNQAKAFDTSIEKIIDSSNKNSKLLLNEKRLKDARQEYRRRGTPRFIIDTFNDLTQTEKRDMYDTVLLMEKGRKSKNNPYK